jgi:hypothetical protein
MQMNDPHKRGLFALSLVGCGGVIMLKFTLLILVSFGVGLIVIPETWVQHDSAAHEQPAVSSAPEITMETTVVYGLTVVRYRVAGEPQNQPVSNKNSTLTDTARTNLPDLSDKHTI